MCEARVVRASYLSEDGKVILVAVGPDNRRRYRVEVEADAVEQVSELMWRDTEDNFPYVRRPSADAPGQPVPAARVHLHLTADGERGRLLVG